MDSFFLRRLRDVGSGFGSAFETANPFSGQTPESLKDAFDSYRSIFGGYQDENTESGLNILKELPQSIFHTINEPVQQNLSDAVLEDNPIRRAGLTLASTPILGDMLFRGPERLMLSGIEKRLQEELEDARLEQRSANPEEAIWRGLFNLGGATLATVVGPDAAVRYRNARLAKAADTAKATNLAKARGYVDVADVADVPAIPSITKGPRSPNDLRHAELINSTDKVIADSRNLRRTATRRAEEMRRQAVETGHSPEHRESIRRSFDEEPARALDTEITETPDIGIDRNANLLERLADPESKYSQNLRRADLMRELPENPEAVNAYNRAYPDETRLSDDTVRRLEDLSATEDISGSNLEIFPPEKSSPLANVEDIPPSVLPDTLLPEESGIETGFDRRDPSIEGTFDTERRQLGDVTDIDDQYRPVDEILTAPKTDTTVRKLGDTYARRGERGSVGLGAEPDPTLQAPRAEPAKLNAEGKLPWGDEWITPEELMTRIKAAETVGPEYVAEGGEHFIDDTELPSGTEALPASIERTSLEDTGSARDLLPEGHPLREATHPLDKPGLFEKGVRKGKVTPEGEVIPGSSLDEVTNMAGVKEKKKLPELTFEEMVNAVHASDIFGLRKTNELEALRPMTMKQIIQYQKGQLKNTKVAALIKKVTDELHQMATDAGVKLENIESYLPGMYDTSKLTPTQQAAIANMSKKLNLSPGFSLEKVFRNYEEAQNFGLTPKYDNIPDMVGAAAKNTFRSSAYRKYWNYLKQNKLISTKPTGILSKGIDPNYFPITKDRRVFYTTPEEAVKIRNYFKELGGRGETAANVLKEGAGLQRYIKDTSLAAGVPRTAINAHGLMMAAQRLATGPDMINNPIKATENAASAFKELVDPRTSRKGIADNLDSLQEFMEEGMTWASEEHSRGPSTFKKAMSSSEGFFGKVRAGQKWIFEAPLFDVYIPWSKLKTAMNVRDSLIQSGVSRKAAVKQAAEFVNEAYGGVNAEAKGRSKGVGAFAQIFLTAPDWLESQAKFHVNIIKALKDPNSVKGQAYRKVAKNMVAMYTLANAANIALTGKAMIENASGTKSGIDLGTAGSEDEGGVKHRTLSPWGQSTNWTRVAHDTMIAIAEGRYDQIGKIAKNRLSGFGQLFMAALTNQDYKEDRLLGKDRWGKKQSGLTQLANVADVVIDSTAPQQLSSTYRYARGQAGAEEAIMKGFEGPLSYRRVRDEEEEEEEEVRE